MEAWRTSCPRLPVCEEANDRGLVIREAVIALAEYKRISKVPNAMEEQVVVGGMGFVEGVARKIPEANQTLSRLRALAESHYIDPYMIAAVYAGLENKNQAFDWLNKGIDERSSSMVYLKVDPFFDTLHADPRFADLLRRIGLQQ